MLATPWAEWVFRPEERGATLSSRRDGPADVDCGGPGEMGREGWFADADAGGLKAGLVGCSLKAWWNVCRSGSGTLAGRGLRPPNWGRGVAKSRRCWLQKGVMTRKKMDGLREWMRGIFAIGHLYLRAVLGEGSGSVESRRRARRSGVAGRRGGWQEVRAKAKERPRRRQRTRGKGELSMSGLSLNACPLCLHGRVLFCMHVGH